MFETKGRKNVVAYIDGGLYVVKKPQALGGTLAVLIPKEWVDAVSLGRTLRYFLLDIRQADIVVKPYFDELPEGVA